MRVRTILFGRKRRLSPVSTPRRNAQARLFLGGVAALTTAVWASACGDGATELPPDPPRPAAVTVSPAAAEMTALGETVQLTASVSDQNGQALADNPVSWTSGDTAVATVSASGLVTAIGNGTATITAVAGEASGHAVALVMQSAGSVIVTPAEDSIAQGDTLRLSAQALDENGHAIVGVNFGWASSNGSVATVDASGLVRGVAEGTATISAVAGSARGTAQITVSNPDRAVLVALYDATDGRNWINSENWLTEAPLRDWYGVEVAGDRVLGLDLSLNGLSGPIPPELGDLAELNTLDLADNSLTGPIPPELGGLTVLRSLQLFDNALSGPIPPELGNLASLGYLILDRNEFSGPMPPELGKLKNLRVLGVVGNTDLRGEIPLEVLELDLIGFESYLTGLCVPRTGRFESYISRAEWIGYACGETEPGFQIRFLYSPDTPDYIREVMSAQAEYWMTILSDTEAPDLFGESLCFSSNFVPPSPSVIDDIIVRVNYGEERLTTAGICGSDDLLRHRIPYDGHAYLNAEHSRTLYESDPRRLELVARHMLGHVLGIGSLWQVRGQLENPSTAEEVRDTYVVSPLATAAFDAAGGTSFAGPKVPLQQRGEGGRNSHWRTEVFGSELMSWGWSDHVPTSAVTLQGLADLGYTVNMDLADSYRLPGAVAVGADASPPLEPGWEAPPAVVVCRPRAQPPTEPEGLRTGLLLRRSVLRSNVCAPAW